MAAFVEIYTHLGKQASARQTDTVFTAAAVHAPQRQLGDFC